MRFFRSKRSIVGCDLGRSAVKLVQLAPQGNGWKVLHAEIRELTPEPRSDEKWPSTQAVQAAAGCSWLDGQPVAVGLQSRPAVLRHLDLPRIPKRELREALRWEAKKATSMPVEDLIVDYLAGSVTKKEGGGTTMPITLIAAERAAVEWEFEFYRQAGFPVKAMEINPLAFYYAARRLGRDQTGSGFVAYVDIGAGRMDINIAKQGMLRFTRSIPLGGDLLTQSLATKFGIDMTEAETIKREQGLSGKPKVLEVLAPEVDRLVVEIQRSIDYYRAQSHDGALTNLWLAGGTPLTAGFIEYISSFFDAKVAVFNPFEGMDCRETRLNLDDLAPRFVSSVGLALRGHG
ncbi:MAG: type IV pilus assembly protein PilM [Nitrospiria bacterium]